MESNKINHINKNNEYTRRINAVLDHLDQDYASEQSLEALAGIANFSPFHFHRIFKGIVGESLYKYIQRIRIEKTAGQLKHQQQKSVIALDCGFTNSASFARTFKAYFSMSASAWRKSPDQRFSKNCKVQSKHWQKNAISSMYTQATWKCRFRANLGHQSKAQHAYNGYSLIKCCNAALMF